MFKKNSNIVDKQLKFMTIYCIWKKSGTAYVFSFHTQNKHDRLTREFGDICEEVGEVIVGVREPEEIIRTVENSLQNLEIGMLRTNY